MALPLAGAAGVAAGAELQKGSQLGKSTVFPVNPAMLAVLPEKAQKLGVDKKGKEQTVWACLLPSEVVAVQIRGGNLTGQTDAFGKWHTDEDDKALLLRGIERAHEYRHALKRIGKL